jgi:hypothetical protein
MNVYRYAGATAAMCAAAMAGCDGSTAPASKNSGATKGVAPAHVTVVVLGSGTSSVQGLRAAADFTPGDAVADGEPQHAHLALGAGLKPSRGASGISP